MADVRVGGCSVSMAKAEAAIREHTAALPTGTPYAYPYYGHWCQAQNRVFLVTMGSDRWTCDQCGQANSILLTGRIGQALMRRASNELQTARDPD